MPRRFGSAGSVAVQHIDESLTLRLPDLPVLVGSNPECRATLLMPETPISLHGILLMFL